ncbi:MAG: cob(I)yrinic acid a,c-diamide adenosyltransferase [Vicinamibacterales bacterium]
MPLYTGVGDRGTTALFDGTIVSKADGRVMAYGEVDELNAIIGLAHSVGLPESLQEMAIAIQRDLFAVGARLANPSSQIAERVSKTVIDGSHVSRLERCIDELDDSLPKLRRFILPGGSHVGAVLHHARVVCRRAERRIVTLGVESLDPQLVRYMNRLSDLLFVMARTANETAGSKELEW